jgi:hypothetical protein
LGKIGKSCVFGMKYDFFFQHVPVREKIFFLIITNSTFFLQDKIIKTSIHIGLLFELKVQLFNWNFLLVFNFVINPITVGNDPLVDSFFLATTELESSILTVGLNSILCYTLIRKCLLIKLLIFSSKYVLEMNFVRFFKNEFFNLNY